MQMQQYLNMASIRFVNNHTVLPIIITENGCATADDIRRVEFLRCALAGVKRCVDDGIPVKEYCCRSFLDNFEWQQGVRHYFWTYRCGSHNPKANIQTKSCVSKEFCPKAITGDFPVKTKEENHT
jgi:beta-glucosidase/6-phospho-beta-glucosidase/beta-galactosidase